MVTNAPALRNLVGLRKIGLRVARLLRSRSNTAHQIVFAIHRQRKIKESPTRIRANPERILQRRAEAASLDEAGQKSASRTFVVA